MIVANNAVYVALQQKLSQVKSVLHHRNTVLARRVPSDEKAKPSLVCAHTLLVSVLATWLLHLTHNFLQVQIVSHGGDV